MTSFLIDQKVLFRLLKQIVVLIIQNIKNRFRIIFPMMKKHSLLINYSDEQKNKNLIDVNFFL